MSRLTKPKVRPLCPNFASGPTAKIPGFSLSKLQGASLGRSHRHAQSISKIQEVFELTREMLDVPKDFQIAIVPGSDTGAVEMAIWNFVNGDRPVSTLYWESFGEGWATDVVNLVGSSNVIRHSAPYGEIPDLSKVDWTTDIVFAWNGTTSGVKIPLDELQKYLPKERENIVISDITSAAFALPIDWSLLDVACLSWQKALGGEAAHGMLLLSPRAISRLEANPPTRALPKIFRLLDSSQKLNRALFQGNVINTISMLCLEDWRQCLLWAKSIGREGLFERCVRNVAALNRAVTQYDWLEFLAVEDRIRSPCGCCLRVKDMSIEELKKMVALLDEEKVAFDILTYRAAPPGIRIWCGCTIEESDVIALVPWLGWAHEMVKNPPRVSLQIRKASSMKCLIADGLDSDAIHRLSEAGIEVIQRTASEGHLSDIDALCVRSATQVTSDLLDQFGGNLKVVARAGVGIDNIDVDAASQRGVHVVNAPTAASIAVTELTIAHSLSILRGIAFADRAAREGLWIKSKLTGVELCNRYVGVIGFGRIGLLVADRFRAFGAHVIAYDPYPPAMKQARVRDFEVVENLDDLFPKVSLITLHVPLDASTRHLVDARRIALMPRGSYIVNVARGGLVDEAALLEALNSGQIAAAASDVFEVEPFRWEEQTVRALIQHPHFESTPHIGAQTKEAQKRVGAETAAAIIESLQAVTEG